MSWDSQAHSGVASWCRSCRYLRRSGHALGLPCSLWSRLLMQILSLFTSVSWAPAPEEYCRPDCVQDELSLRSEQVRRIHAVADHSPPSPLIARIGDSFMKTPSFLPGVRRRKILFYGGAKFDMRLILWSYICKSPGLNAGWCLTRFPFPTTLSLSLSLCMHAAIHIYIYIIYIYIYIYIYLMPLTVAAKK